MAESIALVVTPQIRPQMLPPASRWLAAIRVLFVGLFLFCGFVGMFQVAVLFTIAFLD